MSSLRDPSSSHRVVSLALLLAVSLYLSLAVLAIYCFGSSLEVDVMHNVENEAGHNAAKAILRATFAIVLVCHIPYMFFCSKECFLMMVDEVNRKTISKELECKVKAYARAISTETGDFILA